MTKLRIIILGFCCCFIANLENAWAGPLPSADSADCNIIPPLNKKVNSFVTSRINKKEGNGNCWALAKGALDAAGASWDGAYAFGVLLDPAKDCIFPGDIIQFEGVEIRYSRNGVYYEEHFQHHTAVIYKVLDKGRYKLAHQNIGRHKKVTITDLDVKNRDQRPVFYLPPCKIIGSFFD
jgi:hypothetical protein